MAFFLPYSGCSPIYYPLLKIGVTGGIGSGKSVVCSVFESLGIPVFRADDAARHLMNSDPVLRSGIAALLGADVYVNDQLNRERVSAIIFKDPALLERLNSLVHPATIQYGKDWITAQTAPYVIKEAAIFFESGSNKEMDLMIGVSCPLELRIARVMKRGGQTREKVHEIIARQMDDAAKMKLCDHVVLNDDVAAVIPQVLALHEVFLRKQ